METILPRLHASVPEPLGFGPALEIRAFLLERDRGNLLIYRSASLEQDVEAVRKLGGISRQYLNHHHEASPACDWVASELGAPLHCHADDAAEAAKICTVAETFSERHRLDDDFEIIPIPGHTPGATAYLWDTGEHRVLFTGDTIFFSKGRWQAALLEGVGDRPRHIESLELIRTLDFDYVIPGVASEGEPYYAQVETSEAEQRIDGIIERLRRGESG
ncbi:MAG: MBL fold metallo-hydrolase [Chloroflexota bacterium]|nr:MBL fold metallo-hydrolase [Chloroflexota bacterium]